MKEGGKGGAKRRKYANRLRLSEIEGVLGQTNKRENAGGERALK